MYTVRFFKPTDMFAVIKLASDNLPERYNPSLFNYFYETNPKGFIVAEAGHKTIGFIIGVKINSDNAKILMLAVSEKYRKQKIGTYLLNQLNEQLKKDKIKKVELQVRIDNEKAINFYEKNGFKITEKIPEFYQNGETAYSMRKDMF